MSKWDLIDVFGVAIVCLLVLFLSWAFFVAMPNSLAYEKNFIDKCTRLGGVPSKYETMIGKTNYSERLCIKSENIVTIEMR
jgi:hypothetical protein